MRSARPGQVELRIGLCHYATNTTTGALDALHHGLVRAHPFLPGQYPHEQHLNHERVNRQEIRAPVLLYLVDGELATEGGVAGCWVWEKDVFEGPQLGIV